MSKTRKVVAVLAMVCIVVALFPSTPLEEYQASEKVGSELLEMMNVTYDELTSGDFVDSGNAYSCVIWIEDVEIEEAVEAGIEAANSTVSGNMRSKGYESNYTLYEVEGITYVDVNLDDSASDDYVQAYIEAEREVATELYKQNNNSFVADNFMARDMSVTYVSQYSPCIFANLSVSKISELVENEHVLQIEFWNENEYELDGISTYLSENDITYGASLMGIQSAKTNYNVTGDGIKIGQVELACPEDENVKVNPDAVMDSTTILHANTVYSILHTVAPDATFYAASEATISGICEQIEWLLSQGVNIINMSAGQEGEGIVNTYTEWTRWIDHITFNHDVHFVKSSGNSMNDTDALSGVSAPGMAYNIVTVGNVLPNGSYTINATSSYNDDGISRTGGRTYKPDIVAVGTYGGYNEYDKYGTSYAAPMVAGTIALMCEYQPSLKTKQFVVKAILAASTLESSHNHITEDAQFEVYGSGILYAPNTLDAIDNGTYITSTGSLTSSVTTRTYSMTVSSNETTKRVALTYGNTIKFSSSSHTLSGVSNPIIAEVGIKVYAPNGACVASLKPNTTQVGANLKIVEFSPQAYGGGTYTIEIIMGTSSSDGKTTYFGVAWQ